MTKTTKTKKMKDYVSILIEGFGSLHTQKHALNFFAILKDAGQEFLPIKISVAEPINILFSMDSAVEIWMDSGKEFAKFGSKGMGGVIFKGRNIDDFYGSVDWSPRYNNILINVSIEFLNSASNGFEKLIEIAKKLFIWSNAVYGYAYHSSQSSVHYIPGIRYTTCLGGITWMTLFGQPYIDFFGRQLLNTVPCKVEEFEPDKYILLTSEEPVIPTDGILKTQEAVKLHLGKDVFYRHEDEDSRPKIISVEDFLAGKDRPNTEGYRAPNFSKYVK